MRECGGQKEKERAQEKKTALLLLRACSTDKDIKTMVTLCMMPTRLCTGCFQVYFCGEQRTCHSENRQVSESPDEASSTCTVERLLKICNPVVQVQLHY